jgi:hypothetical protein
MDDRRGWKADRRIHHPPCLRAYVP